MKLVIVTGMSGAGKTIALKMLEDMGFYCVDNLPISLVDKFAQLAAAGSDISQAALGIDIRSGEELNQLDAVLRGWRELGMDYQILFLDANDGVLIKRYKETRRSHPLAGTGRLDKGIEKERGKLAFLKKDADFIIDTSKLLTRELRQELEKIFLKRQEYCNMFVTVLSFGGGCGPGFRRAFSAQSLLFGGPAPADRGGPVCPGLCDAGRHLRPVSGQAL